MFDLGAAEILVIIIVAVLVIGPKDMPLAMRTVGRWVGQIRKVSAHFRTGIDAMVREAELEDMEKKWKARNEEIMKRTAVSAEAKAGEPVMTGPPPTIDAGDLSDGGVSPTPAAAPIAPPVAAPTAPVVDSERGDSVSDSPISKPAKADKDNQTETDG